jgi:hypothetical protein
MHERCPHCEVKFSREDGFFLGSIYINYGLTSLIVAIVYPLLLFKYRFNEQMLLWACFAFVIVFPMLFFPHARALWLGFDQYWDPRPGTEGYKPNRSDDEVSQR